jgi:DNA polymerase-3 subunit delta'
MSLRDERDLPWLAEPLQALRDGNRGHALILHGGAGSGQLELALRLAQAWLCEQGPGPCDACPSCHLAIARSHPDLRVVMPEAVQVALQRRRKPQQAQAQQGNQGRGRAPSH